MQFPIVREFKTDIAGDNPENEIIDEPRSVQAGIWSRIIVPKKAPFFVKDLVVKSINGKELTPEVDYRVYRLMSRLTALTGEDVAATIELIKPDITDVLISYKVVGEFTLIDNGFLQLVEAAMHDNRPIWWDNLHNKPVVYTPKLHPHSVLYDIVAWQDFVDFLGDIMRYMTEDQKNLIEIRLEHFLKLIQHYIALYRDTLGTFLKRHTETYNSHGLLAEDVQLEKVDNFATARGNSVLQGRDDMHVLVSGLRSIIENYGFNGDEFLAADTLPISRFGNTNFIPPAIDGSFEGLGGQEESAGISMEPDGSVVFLENRFDGRVEGLYYSVVPSLEVPYAEKVRQYTAYPYIHQRLEADNIQMNRIAGGSGDEVILMADTRTETFYVGLTYGSLNPANHVLSRLDVSAIKSQIPNNLPVSDFISAASVVLMKDWIYIIMSHRFVNKVSGDGGVAQDSRFKHFYRVPRASVAAQLPVTAAQVNLTYRDSDGVQWNNTPYWRWCTPVGSYPFYTKYYFPFKQQSNIQSVGAYRSQPIMSCEVPSKPGNYVLKFLSSFWGSYVSGTQTSAWECMLEITYEMNPDTNVMTLLHQTPKFTLDWLNPPPIDGNLRYLTTGYDKQSAMVLPNGTLVATHSAYQGFPRFFISLSHRDLKTKYDMITRQFNSQLGPTSGVEWVGRAEPVLSPIASGVRTRAFMLGNGGDFYCAAFGDEESGNKLFYRQAPGKLAQRAEVTNKYWTNIRVRPLSNKVWEVRSDPRVGGATVTCPAAQLDSFSTDLGLTTFCMGTQKKYAGLTAATQSPGWPIPTQDDAVVLISGHTTSIAADGKMDVTATGTITYPAAIVDLLKREVESVSGMQGSPKVIVNICDPTGDLTARFGWLPVLVGVTYVQPGTRTRRMTFMSITPTYSGGVNKTVTGFTVLDKLHMSWPTYAAGYDDVTWDATIAGGYNGNSHGPMRCGYHVNGARVEGFFDSGITAQGPGDSMQAFAEFVYPNKATRRWSQTATDTFLTITGNTGSGNHRAVVPDQGVVVAIPHVDAAGGAATIFNGSSYRAMLGHVYPEVGWILFFKLPMVAVFNGKKYTIPAGNIDLRDVVTDATNKTFYIYAVLRDGVAFYEVALDKRLESPFQVWVGTARTNLRQIETVDRFNVFTVSGHRVSDIKRGNSIPASTGLVDSEGQFPWLRSDELLP